MMYHFAWNLLIHIMAINPVENNGNIFPYIILNILEALALAVLWSVRRIYRRVSQFTGNTNVS